MSKNYRYWCGECSHRTPWATESEGAELHQQHYIRNHPRVDTRGRVEVKDEEGERNGGGFSGCLGVMGVLFVLMILASTCSGESSSAPVPPAVCESCAPETAVPAVHE